MRASAAGRRQHLIRAHTVLLVEGDDANFSDSSYSAHSDPTKISDASGPTSTSGTDFYGNTVNMIDFERSSNEGLSFADSADWTFGTDDYTVMCKFKAETIDGATNQMLVSQNYGTNPQWSLYVNGTVMECDARDGTNTSVSNGATTLVVNTWYEFAFVGGSFGTEVYLNGVYEDFDTDTPNLTDVSAALLIGQDPTSARDTDGLMHSIHIIKGLVINLQKATAADQRIPQTATRFAI